MWRRGSAATIVVQRRGTRTKSYYYYSGGGGGDNCGCFLPTGSSRQQQSSTATNMMLCARRSCTAVPTRRQHRHRQQQSTRNYCAPSTTTTSSSSSRTLASYCAVGDVGGGGDAASRTDAATKLLRLCSARGIGQSSRRRQNSTSANSADKTKKKKAAAPTATSIGDRIRPRPPEEEDGNENKNIKGDGVGDSVEDDDLSKSRFPLPDKEKERELSDLKDRVEDLYRAGNYRQGLKAAQELLERTESHFAATDGGNHPAIAAAHNNVGLMQKQLGRFDDSRFQYRKAMQIYKRAVGQDHASYATALHNLGTLNRTQIHFDASLKATDRLCLVEESVELLQQAFRIREQEYGPDHPLAVASRSGWGASLSAQILHYYKRQSVVVNSSSGGRRDGDNSGTETTTTTEYRTVLSPERVSSLGWDVAEQHLREALRTAVDNPRGPGVHDRSATNRNKKKGKKAANQIHQSSKDDPNAKKIETLSGASAAQNLAIFLKSRATTVPKQTSRDAKSSTVEPTNQDWQMWNDEALRLYREVLDVRQKLLPRTHPDLYATKHSLAELLESMGDQEAANAIRQEIVDAYDNDDGVNEGKSAGAGK